MRGTGGIAPSAERERDCADGGRVFTESTDARYSGACDSPKGGTCLISPIVREINSAGGTEGCQSALWDIRFTST